MYDPSGVITTVPLAGGVARLNVSGSPLGSVKFSDPEIAPVTGSGTPGVAPADSGAALTGAAAARAAKDCGAGRVWLVSTVAGAVLGAGLSSCRLAAAATAQAIGASMGAGAGATGALGSVGVRPTTDATPEAIVDIVSADAGVLST